MHRRRLNDVAVRESYSVPRIVDCTDLRSETAILTTQVYNSRHCQLDASEADRKPGNLYILFRPPSHSDGARVEEHACDLPKSRPSRTILNQAEERTGVPGRRAHLLQNREGTFDARLGGTLVFAAGKGDSEVGGVHIFRYHRVLCRSQLPSRSVKSR